MYIRFIQNIFFETLQRFNIVTLFYFNTNVIYDFSVKLYIVFGEINECYIQASLNIKHREILYSGSLRNRRPLHEFYLSETHFPKKVYLLLCIHKNIYLRSCFLLPAKYLLTMSNPPTYYCSKVCEIMVAGEKKSSKPVIKYSK